MVVMEGDVTLLLAMSLLTAIKSGNASRFGFVGDPYDNVGTYACRRTLTARHGAAGFEHMRQRGVAHRTLPCGTPIGICLTRTGLCTTAYVVDRGPWGVLDRKGEWHMRTGRLLPGEYYRGELDLLPGVYTALALVGIERVSYWQVGSSSGVRPAEDGTPTRPTYPPLRLADPDRRLASLSRRVAGFVDPYSFPPLRLEDDPLLGAQLAAIPPYLAR